jgi:hypothetical protein
MFNRELGTCGKEQSPALQSHFEGGLTPLIAADISNTYHPESKLSADV